jgi:hypothetical protein
MFMSEQIPVPNWRKETESPLRDIDFLKTLEEFTKRRSIEDTQPVPVAKPTEAHSTDILFPVVKPFPPEAVIYINQQQRHSRRIKGLLGE